MTAFPVRETAAETAYAKINLALHVRRRMPDGYHDLETLFAFCADGDELTAAPADDLSLTIVGPFGEKLSAGPDNLVLRAAEALRAAAGTAAGAAIRLDKRLPVASGIGGGSADAAAALRLLVRLWDVAVADETLHGIAATLGADVPACMVSQTCRGEGRGDRLDLLDARALTGIPLLLVKSACRRADRAGVPALGPDRSRAARVGGSARCGAEWAKRSRAAGACAAAGDRVRGRGAVGDARSAAGTDVGLGRDLFRAVRGCGGARRRGCGNRGGASALVAAGVAVALGRSVLFERTAPLSAFERRRAAIGVMVAPLGHLVDRSQVGPTKASSSGDAASSARPRPSRTVAARDRAPRHGMPSRRSAWPRGRRRAPRAGGAARASRSPPRRAAR